MSEGTFRPPGSLLLRLISRPFRQEIRWCFAVFGCVSKKVSGCWFLVISSHQQQQSKVDFYWDFRRDVPAPGEPLVLKPSLQAACRDLLSPFHSQISVWEPSAWEPLLWNLLKECVVFCCFIWWYVFCECVEHVVTALLVRWHLGHNVFGIVFQKSDLVKCCVWETYVCDRWESWNPMFAFQTSLLWATQKPCSRYIHWFWWSILVLDISLYPDQRMPRKNQKEQEKEINNTHAHTQRNKSRIIVFGLVAKSLLFSFGSVGFFLVLRKTSA